MPEVYDVPVVGLDLAGVTQVNLLGQPDLRVLGVDAEAIYPLPGTSAFEHEVMRSPTDQDQLSEVLGALKHHLRGGGRP